MDSPTQAQVVVDGTVLGECTRRGLEALRRRRIGYVFQDLNLLASLTAAENVALPLPMVDSDPNPHTWHHFGAR